MNYLQDTFNSFVTRWQLGQVDAFADFATAVRDGAQGGTFSETDGARALAAAMFVEGVDDDPLREEITIVAGDLETGQPTDTRHTWHYLSALIDELGPRGRGELSKT